jgi:DNA-binding NarL/FixJ family response regulator
MLAAMGMAVVGRAGTPQGSTAGILATEPDVVVLDVQLEGGSGLQVLRAVRSAAPAVAFIVFSHHSSAGFRRRYLAEGAWQFIDKATEFDQLALAVARAAEHITPFI